MLRFRIKKKLPQIAAAKLIAVLADRRSLSRDMEMRNTHRTNLQVHDQLVCDGMFGTALVEIPQLTKKHRTSHDCASDGTITRQHLYTIRSQPPSIATTNG